MAQLVECWTSRSRDCCLESHPRHCVVSVTKTLYPLISTGMTEKLLTGM